MQISAAASLPAPWVVSFYGMGPRSRHCGFVVGMRRAASCMFLLDCAVDTTIGSRSGEGNS